MKWNYIVTTAIGMIAAGSAALSYKIFKKTVVRNDAQKAADIKMGTSWDKHAPLIKGCREWMQSINPSSHYITSKDGLKLAAKYIKSDVPTHKTIIAVHGYKSSGTYEFSAIARMYHEHNYNVLLVDDRAHGESEGKYIGFGILDRYDVYEWIKYVTKNIDPDAVIYLHGISMGGASVLMASAFDLPDNVKGIIADCAFTNPKDIIESVFRKKTKLPLKPLLYAASAICKKTAGYSFGEASTVDALKSNTLPVLFIHGSADSFVPSEMTQKNFEACTSQKKLVIIEGASHAESFYHNPELYEQSVLNFINK